MRNFLGPCLGVSLCCSRLYFVLKCFLMKVLCHLSVSPLIGIYNNVKIENILNSNFLLALRRARQGSEITTIHRSFLISSINEWPFSPGQDWAQTWSGDHTVGPPYILGNGGMRWDIAEGLRALGENRNRERKEGRSFINHGDRQPVN